GVYRFTQLAAMPATEVKTILENAGARFQMHDPTTWGLQAELAAAANWDELRQLQDNLKGGRI
ncbi:MAG: 50S ribosomal protein L27, partial [Bacteroidota bacterium]